MGTPEWNISLVNKNFQSMRIMQSTNIASENVLFKNFWRFKNLFRKQKIFLRSFLQLIKPIPWLVWTPQSVVKTPLIMKIIMFYSFNNGFEISFKSLKVLLMTFDL